MDPSLTRRRLLAGLGAATGVAAVATAVPAGAQEPGPNTSFPWPNTARAGAGVRVAAFAPTPGRSYLVLDATSFDGIDGLRNIDQEGATGVSAGEPLFAPVNLPLGSVLTELVLMYVAPAVPAPEAGVYRMTPGDGYTPLAVTALPTGAGPLETTFSLNETVNGSASYFIFVIFNDTSHFVQGLRIGYTPPPSGFIANNPIPRVFDTRTSPLGKMQINEERVVALGTPGLAKAAVINLTITETEGSGFAAAFPANVLWTGNSSINWSDSGQNLANGVITATDPTGQIKMLSGAGRTHVVIDVQGYIL